MKRLLSLITILVVALLGIESVYASEYGVDPSLAKYRYVISDGKALNVREGTSTKSKVLLQLKPGDIVYVESPQISNANGYDWLEISDKWRKSSEKKGYVTNLDRFIREVNPLYESQTAEQQSIENSVESGHNVAKWILLVLAIIAAFIYITAYFSENAKEKLIGEEEDGMRRTFFFNIAPYRAVIYVTLLLIASVLTAVVIMLLVGGAAFVLLWIVKILCYVLLWIGIIACVLGVICCLFGAFAGAIPAILGGIIWYYEDPITGFGEKCATAGLEFFNEFNMFSFTKDLFVEYWQPGLMIVCAPLALFLALALIWMLIAGSLIGFEKVMTWRYNVKHPCPHCQEPSEPATYLSKSDEEGYLPLPNDIRLRPGMYGLFHIVHPQTEESMPTMILNGRDKLPRCCANCGHMIQADEGTEMHIAMVGSAQSGKSTLTYRMIAEIFNRAGEDCVKFTDETHSIKDRAMVSKIMSICSKNRMDESDMPRKTALNDNNSTQLIIKRNRMSIPYRLFINDIGGEHFDPSSGANKQDATRYFRNVDSILFIIDPITTDLSDCDPSNAYLTWLKKFDTSVNRKLPIDDIKTTIDNQLSQMNNNSKNVHLNLVLTKKDLGYIPDDVDINDQNQLKSYLAEEMGLGNLLHWSGKFASCSFYAVGATSQGNDSNVQSIINQVIVNQLGIKI